VRLSDKKPGYENIPRFGVSKVASLSYAKKAFEAKHILNSNVDAPLRRSTLQTLAERPGAGPPFSAGFRTI